MPAGVDADAVRASAGTVGFALFEVLQEAAAAGDVEDLEAAADAEERRVGLKGVLDEGDLDLVTVGVYLGDAVAAGLAVAGGVEIDAGGDEDAVVRREGIDALEGGGVEGDGFATGALDAACVVVPVFAEDVFGAGDEDAGWLGGIGHVGMVTNGRRYSCATLAALLLQGFTLTLA